MILKTSLYGKTYEFKDVKEVLAKANEPKSGDAERRIRSNWCNHYENKLTLRAGRPYKLDVGLESATGLDTNYITNEDPGFVDLENRDYRIRPDAELFKHIPDFIPPAFEKMGPTND